MTIHITFKVNVRSMSKRIKKFSASILDVDSNPVTARFVGGVGVTDQ